MHHRIALVTGPREVQVAPGTVVEPSLGVPAVVRMRHADVVPDFVNRRAGEPITQRTIDRGAEREDERLGAVHPIVVGKPEQPELGAETSLGGVEREHRRHVVVRPVLGDVGAQVLGEIAEGLSEGRPDALPAPGRHVVEGERVERVLGTRIDGVHIPQSSLPAVVGLEAAPTLLGERRVHRGQPRTPGIVLEHRNVGDPAPTGTRRGVQRIVERGRRKEEVDGDVTCQQPHIGAELRQRPITVGGVLPDRRHPVLGHAVAVQILDVHHPVGRVVFRPGREVVEPGAAVGTTPRVHGAAPAVAEVVARVRIGIVCLRVDVKTEVRSAVPVDEVDLVALAGRMIVIVQPALDARPVDEEHRAGDVEDVVGLIVVAHLEDGRRSFRSRARQELKELPFEPVSAPGHRIVEFVRQAHVTPVESVELRVTHDRLIRVWQQRQDILALHSLVVEADQHDLDRHRLFVHHECSGLEPAQRAEARLACGVLRLRVRSQSGAEDNGGDGGERQSARGHRGSRFGRGHTAGGAV